MDSLPDAVVQYILSNMSYAKDLASCNCVSKKWKDLMTCHNSLCFPPGIFDNLRGPQTPDSIVMQMVSSVSRLEDLIVLCRFSSIGLASWLLVVGSSLKNLELRIGYDDTKLECIQAARNLESLRLWRVEMAPTPKWDVFQKLRNLEIRGAKLEDSVLTEVLHVTPNLTRLVLRKCDGSSIVNIELCELRHFELYVSNWDSTSLTLRTPKIEYLEVKGCNWIRVHETNFLKNLSISNYLEPVLVDFSNLMALESLCVQGHRWRWDVTSKILQLATEVKHLRVDIGISGDHGQSLPFPKIDFVDLFKSHPKLESFNIGGAMLVALCKKKSLKNVTSSFVFPSLEEVVIVVSSLSNVKKMMKMLDTFVKYANKLKKIKIKTLQTMEEDGADDEEICRTFILASSSCLSIRYRVLRDSTRELDVILTQLC